jgi:hypothetical protein
MIGNLRSVMASSVAAYPATPRIQWVLQWPGQAVLAVTGIYWTKSIADALASGTPGSLQGVAEENTKNLADIVTLVRGKLQRLQRATLSALVVMDVHARDAAAELACQVLQLLLPCCFQVTTFACTAMPNLHCLQSFLHVKSLFVSYECAFTRNACRALRGSQLHLHGFLSSAFTGRQLTQPHQQTWTLSFA